MGGGDCDSTAGMVTRLLREWRPTASWRAARAVPLVALTVGCASRGAERPVPVSTPAPPPPVEAHAPPPAEERPSTVGGAGPGPTEDPGPPPLVAEGPLADLEVPGHGSAVVALPLGATEARPLLVATHGNYDRPDWTCAIWRSVIAERGFVLCPRGVARGDSPSPSDLRFHYLTNLHLEREIDAALRALEAQYGDYLAEPPYVYAGFSQGAIMGVPILGRRPEWFDRAVLVEGGFDRWSQAQVAAFAAAGGRRILFACGQWSCDHGGRAAGRWFSAAGVESRVVYAQGAGHTYGGEIAELVTEAWDWVVVEDQRWRSDPEDAQASSRRP